MTGKIHADAALFGYLGDLLRAIFEAAAVGVHHEVGEHGVVRVPERFLEAYLAAHDPVVVLYVPGLGLIQPDVDLVLLFLRGVLGVRVDALLEGRYEGEDLEGAARLAPALGGEAELGVLVSVTEHGLAVARPRLDGDEGGVGGVGQIPAGPVRDVVGRDLVFEVYGCIDAKAALQNGVGPVAS